MLSGLTFRAFSIEVLRRLSSTFVSNLSSSLGTNSVVTSMRINSRLFVSEYVSAAFRGTAESRMEEALMSEFEYWLWIYYLLLGEKGLTTWNTTTAYRRYQSLGTNSKEFVKDLVVLLRRTSQSRRESCYFLGFMPFKDQTTRVFLNEEVL